MGILGAGLDAGLSLLGAGAKWSLTCQDTQSLLNWLLYIEGQGRAENIQYTYSGRDTTQSEMGSYEPVVVPLGMEAIGITFDAKWVSRHAWDDSCKKAKADLTWCMVKDPFLGRKPLFLFTNADESYLVFVQSVQFRHPNGHWQITGYPIVLEASITLTVTTVKEFKALTIEPETSYHPIVLGESFESVALRYYGDPDMGIGLRRVNPTVDDEQADTGIVLKVLDASHSAMADGNRVQALAFVQSPDLIEDLASDLMRAASVRYEELDAAWLEFDGHEVT